MELDYKLFDKVTSTFLVNLMVEDQRNKGIVLSSFNPNNINHLYAFEVALILSNSIQKEFYLDMGIYSYWKFRLKNWSVRKSFKRYNSTTPASKMELDKILDFMKESLELKDDTYEQIYKEYYTIGNENRSIYRWKRKK